MRRALHIVAISLGLIPVWTGAQSAGSQGAEQATKQLTWDVVSVKPHKQMDAGGSMYMRPDGVEINNLTIHSLVWSAFDIRSMDQISGWPDWADSEHFDVQAKLTAEDAEIWQKLRGSERNRQWRQLMLSILEDRFALRAHQESRELSVYYLEIAKKGAKLKEATPDSSSLSNYGPGKISAKATPIENLVVNLSGIAGRMVVDKTGLKGKYDIELTWSQDNQPEASAPSIFTALEEELGLKLQPGKAMVNVYVIDHIQRPSEN